MRETPRGHSSDLLALVRGSVPSAFSRAGRRRSNSSATYPVTHCLPMSFYRTSEHKRDGTENLLDRAYFIMHLEWLTAVLKDSIDFYEKDMDEVKHLRQNLRKS
jgi:hypothetical protein